MKKLIRTTFVVLLGATGSIALLRSALPEATQDTLPSTITAYLAPPTEAPLPSAAPGTAVPANIAGRVWEVYFSAGQRVRKGQVLVKVTEKLRTAEQHRLQLLLAQQQQAYTVLAAQRPAASANALAAAQDLVSGTQKKLAEAPAQLSFLFVTAPQDGIVATRTVAPGDYLAPATIVATLAAPPADDTTLLLSSID
ncbi:efflux RND transporter periplasmic adaptor subunit [Hymenobacter sediminicola]|uniref:Efflux RND transporter periplasmic adaptor subunit n=1 Tax=Hymenobacter sediminicola TaxID=2761579 RepID=A0A7G7W7R8_9BACT|nr:efflux RND transporter periplasmic adaptor subunit [Hymenobacter sediminicola]QNH62411.1 efflux RND transporter periplasmic adaptor subunit [Hymenobacter sediminicola]